MRVGQRSSMVWLICLFALAASPVVVLGAASPVPPSPSAARVACPSPTALPAPSPDAPLVMPEDYRLSLLDTIWQQVNDGYVDTGHNGVDWQAVHADYEQRILQAENAWEAYSVMQEMVALLGDPDTLLVSAPELESQAAQDPTYGGIGILIDNSAAATPESGLRVLYVFPGSPALAAGIASRDLILAVGTDHCPRPELVRGPVGTEVSLLVRSPGEEPRTVSVDRQRIVPVYEPVAGRVAGAPAIGYLRLFSLADEATPAAIDAALGGLLAGEALEGLIIDVRHTSLGAPGVTTSVLGQFVGGEVATLVTHDGETPWRIESGDLRDALRAIPIVLLVDGTTDGEAERLAAVLQSQGRAIVVGQQTPGHTQLIQQLPQPDGSVLQMVVGGLITSDGTRVEGHGVVPDIEMADDWLDQTVDADTWIRTAVTALGNHGSGPASSEGPG